MKRTIVEIILPRSADTTLARLGHTHGYRFDSDTVRLGSMFTVVDAAAHSRAWALQLWACPEVPQANRLSGQLVAEVPLPPIGEIADDLESFEVNVSAVVPAGQRDHVMVLALVAGRNGCFNEIHDLSVYAQREGFCLPRLGGNVGYSIAGDRVVLSAERIENPRAAGNLSGTLALELWALPALYDGGAFAGQPLAGVAFDPLAGQCNYCHRAFNLPFVAPRAGQWNIVMMLREWTAAGFVTRDFVNFNQPFVQAETTKIEAQTLKAAVVVAQVVAKAQPLAAKRQAADQNRVSVNSASAADLAKVKGLPKKVAKVIVKERPFRTLDELVRVKGIGAKLLARIRSSLKL